MSCCGIPVVQCVVCGGWVACEEAVKFEGGRDAAVFCSAQCAAAAAGERAAEDRPETPETDSVASP